MLEELKEENRILKLKLNLYEGALHKEHEAMNRINELEEGFKAVNEELREYAEENEKLKKKIKAYEMIPNDIKNIIDILVRNCEEILENDFK